MIAADSWHGSGLVGYLYFNSEMEYGKHLRQRLSVTII
jgi:hypothetical protein